MGSKAIQQYCLAAIAVVMLLCSYTGNSQSGCTSALVGLAPCLNYVTGNSSTPSSSCCSQLTSVVQSQPQCLCTLVNGGGSSLGISINQTLALALPAACSVQTPPVSRCNGVNNGPASAPTSPPSDSSADAPSSATDVPTDTPNSATNVPNLPGGGSKTVPTDGGASAATVAKTPLHFTVLFIFVASIFY